MHKKRKTHFTLFNALYTPQFIQLYGDVRKKSIFLGFIICVKKGSWHDYSRNITENVKRGLPDHLGCSSTFLCDKLNAYKKKKNFTTQFSTIEQVLSAIDHKRMEMWT